MLLLLMMMMMMMMNDEGRGDDQKTQKKEGCDRFFFLEKLFYTGRCFVNCGEWQM